MAARQDVPKARPVSIACTDEEAPMFSCDLKLE
jgi:hypothetical protein